MTNGENSILVRVSDAGEMRDGNLRSLNIDLLRQNVNIFIGQMGSIMESTPDAVGKFKLTEFTVTAEISGKGQLSLLGTGGELSATGGLTFKFERK